MSGFNHPLFLTMALLSLISPASAQTAGASFLENDPSARSFALGNTNVVTSWGAQAVNANPANLGLTAQRFEMFTAYAQPVEGVQYGYLSGAVSLPSLSYVPVDAIGFSAIREQIGGLQGADDLGNSNSNSFGAADMAVSLGASGRIAADLRYGVTAKAVKSSLAGVNSNTAFASDFGLGYALRQFHGLSLGASINNLGPGIRYLDKTNALPLSANLGATLPFGPAMVVASINRMIRDKTTSVGIGMEYAMGPVSLRGGYLAQKESGTNLALKDQSGMGQFMNGLSGGIGLRMGTTRLDYAASAGAAELGPNQKISLTLAWGDKSPGITQPNKRGNTRFINQSSSNPASQDVIDWHLINMRER